MWFSDLALWTQCYSVKIDYWSLISQGIELMHGIVLFSVPDLTIIPKIGRGKYFLNYFSEIFAKI